MKELSEAAPEQVVYRGVVDKIGLSGFITAISQGTRRQIEERIRPLFRTVRKETSQNPLAAIDWYDLHKKLLAEKIPTIAQEMRRRLFKNLRPESYHTWQEVARVNSPTEKEIWKAAHHGLVTPFLEKLPPKAAIPEWLQKPETLYGLAKASSYWSAQHGPKLETRIAQLLDAKIQHYDAFRDLFLDAVRTNNLQRLTKLLEFWPKDRSLPDHCPASLEIAKAISAAVPGAVPSDSFARLYYNAGCREEALKCAREAQKNNGRFVASWMVGTGFEKADIPWIQACAGNGTGRAEILVALLDRGKDHSDLARKLLKQKKWRAAINESEMGYCVQRALLCHGDIQLRDIAIHCAGPKVQLHEWLGKHRGYLAEFLRIRPTDHSDDFWKKLSSAEVRRLVRLAQGFDDRSAREALRKLGQCRAGARHVFEQAPKLKLDLAELLDFSDAVVLEAIALDRLDPDFREYAYALDRTKLRLTTIRKLLSGKMPWAAKISPGGYYHTARSLCLLALSGHQGDPKEIVAHAADSEPKEEITQVLRPLMAGIKDRQMQHLLKGTQKALALEELEKRAKDGGISPALLRRLLYSDDHALFFQWAPAGFEPSAKDLRRMVELKAYSHLEKLLAGRAPYADDRVFHARTQEDWLKLLEIGFRATPENQSEDVQLLHLEKGLWSETQLNSLLCTILEDRSSSRVLPRLVSAADLPPGNVLELYNAGNLDLQAFRLIVNPDRCLETNVKACTDKLDEIQAKAPENKRLCILNYADPNKRWQLLLACDAPHHSLRELSPYGFSVETFKSVLAAGVHEALRAKSDTSQVIVPCFNLTVAFGNLTEIRKVIHKRNLPSKAPLHDLGQFEVPSKGAWNIGAWRQLLAHHSGKGLKLLHLAPRIEAALGRPPETLQEAEELATKCIYSNRDGNPALARICFEYSRSEEQFDEYLALMKQAKTEDQCPDIQLTPSDTGTECSFSRLAPGDPIGPLLGVITNCCQHLHGYASDCAEAGTKDPDASFYVLRRHGRIIAQCFAWRTKTALVFDSWERLSHEYDGLCPSILAAAGQRALEIDPSLEDVRVGTGGGTPRLALPIVKAVKWRRKLEGMDSGSQYLLAQRKAGIASVPQLLAEAA